ncbi:ubiquitin-protein ligase peroxin 12 [Rhizophlyctis rosea]|nr:ubiquitin-protein ligase peroxin 12 [Rhizophlyctis rosea]
MENLSNVGTSSDPYRPSIFELIAQERMRELLQPALRYILTVYAQRYPQYLLRVFNRSEEIYALLMLIVESHYLSVWRKGLGDVDDICAVADTFAQLGMQKALSLRTFTA